MTVNSQDSEHARLVCLIRRIAREEAWEAIDGHVDEYEHNEKPPEDLELGGSRCGKSKKRC
jgi:thioester reductase-like protein